MQFFKAVTGFGKRIVLWIFIYLLTIHTCIRRVPRT